MANLGGNVSDGFDPIESRPGFAALLNGIESNGVRVVLLPACDLVVCRLSQRGESASPKLNLAAE
jgi:hypothetical protein